MTDFQKVIVLLIKSAIDESEERIPQDINWNEVILFGKKHQIISLLYYGVLFSKLQIDSDIKKTLENLTFQYILRDQNQQYYVDKIQNAFEENGIDYMPLKGTLLKHFYPKTEMRSMSDIDILIKTEQYDRIKPILQGLSFREEYQSNHEFGWKKNKSLILELHKSIIPTYNEDFYSCLGDGWGLARKSKDFEHRYVMSPEDEFIYNFVHTAKHYRDGGVGIRHIADFYICKKRFNNLDNAYIEAELKKLQLLEFYNNIKKTVSVWFENEKPSEVTDFITSYIFNSGSYGNKENRIIAEAVRESKKTRRSGDVKYKKLLRLIFLPFDKMCEKYPILIKLPVLLPVMWIVRIIVAIFTKKDVIRVQNAILKKTTAENIDSFQQALNNVGLDFYPKE